MHKPAVVLAFGKFNAAFDYRKNGMVFTNINTITRMVIGAALANNDITRV